MTSDRTPPDPGDTPARERRHDRANALQAERLREPHRRADHRARVDAALRLVRDEAAASGRDEPEGGS